MQLYLLAGYYYTATEEYDIKWTMPHCVLTLKLIGELASGSLYSPLLRFLIVLDGPIMLDLSVIITISHCKPLTSSDKLLMRPLLGLRCWNDDDIISHPNSCTFWLQVCHLITMMAGRIWWVSGWHVCIVIHLLCFSIYKSHLWLRSPTHAVCKVNTLKLDKKEDFRKKIDPLSFSSQNITKTSGNQEQLLSDGSDMS